MSSGMCLDFIKGHTYSDVEAEAWLHFKYDNIHLFCCFCGEGDAMEGCLAQCRMEIFKVPIVETFNYPAKV